MKSKKFVLVGLVLAAITIVLLPLSGCKDAAGNGGGVKVYSFPEEVKVLTADEYTSPNHTGSEWTYVAFGEWPQTIKAEGVDVNETKSKTMGMFTCYLGSDDNYYVKHSDKYYKVEPIVWRVLNKDYASTGNALLLAEKILTGGIPYYVDTSTRPITGAGTKNGETVIVYPNNWQYSTVRAWLNGRYESDDPQDKEYAGKGFLQSAFTESAQKLIELTSVDNSAASTNPASNDKQWNDGKNEYASDTPTTDKIFLLSEKEATNSEYGFDEYNRYVGDDYNTTTSTRIRVTTDYVEATEAYQDSTSGYVGWWWLRSPHYSGVNLARFIDDDGDASNRYLVSLAYGVVVPALSISLQ